MDIINSTNNDTLVTEDNECFLTDEEINKSYKLGLHIASIFVLLAVSLLGASLSVVSTKVKRLNINPIIINTGKFFGSGVVLATGFVHILPDAMETLSDPCLPDSWNVYGAYSGLFAMLSALGMQLIEFLAHQRYRSSRLKHSHLTAHIDIKEHAKKEQMNGKIDEPVENKSTVDNIDQSVSHENEKPKKKKQKNIENIEKTNDNIEEIKKTEEDNNRIELSEETNATSEKCMKKKHHHHHHRSDECGTMVEGPNHSHEPENKDHKDCVAIEILHIEPQSTPLDLCEGAGHFHGAAFQDDNQQNKISTYLLELGIALHSVLIGLTLGTTSESFVALFIALCFHQFFEAIALGAQIAHLKTTSIKSAIFMVIFFSLTTPVGIAIGIGIHSGTYNPKSVSSLLVTGILDSLSAGVLIYVALVNLITAEMGANAHAFYSLSTPLKFLYFIALYLGVAAMAIIGRWA